MTLRRRFHAKPTIRQPEPNDPALATTKWVTLPDEVTDDSGARFTHLSEPEYPNDDTEHLKMRGPDE